MNKNQKPLVRSPYRGKRRMNRVRPIRYRTRYAKEQSLESYPGPAPIYRNLGPLSGEPDMKRMRLRYVDKQQFQASASSFLYVYRGNSLYDPDFTGVGHQPLYFDQQAQLYEKYRVMKSWINVSAVNGTGATTGTVTIVPDTNVLSPTTTYELLEHPRARTSREMPLAGNGTVAIRHKASTAQVCGLVPSQQFDDDYAAVTNTNPLTLWYWHIYTVVNGASLNVVCNIELVYDVIFFDRRQPTPSYNNIVKNPELLPKEDRRFLGQNVLENQEMRDFPPTNVYVTNNTMATTVQNPYVNVKVLPLVQTNK